MAHLMEVALAAEANPDDAVLGYLGLLDGPIDLSETVDKTISGR